MPLLAVAQLCFIPDAACIPWCLLPLLHPRGHHCRHHQPLQVVLAGVRLRGGGGLGEQLQPHGQQQHWQQQQQQQLVLPATAVPASCLLLHMHQAQAPGTSKEPHPPEQAVSDTALSKP
jgi:hypothetical protein